MTTRRRWLVVCVLVALGVVACVLIVRQQSRPDGDCRLAADVFETWTSLSASLNAMVDAPDDNTTEAAESEDAAARDIREKASQIASPDIRAYAQDMADALGQIADAQRSPDAGESVDVRYRSGSMSAAAAAAGLRKECPSIPKDRQ